MRKPIVSDSVWLRDVGGTPWIVIAVNNGGTATIARAGESDREERIANLKIVGTHEKTSPGIGLEVSMLEPMIAFAQAYPNRISELDLHPDHEQELREKIASSPQLPAPNQEIKTGSAVTISEGSFAGSIGIILCHNPRSNSYMVRCPDAPYIFVVPAMSVKKHKN